MNPSKLLIALFALAFAALGATSMLDAQSAAITGLTQITNDKDVDLYPDVAPDGNQVTFESIKDTMNGYGSNYEIMVIDDKGTTARMTTDKADDNNPSWQADQKGIFFDSFRFDKRGIWLKSLVAGGETKLSRGKTVDFDADANPKKPMIVFNGVEKGDDVKMDKDGERWEKFKRAEKMPFIWIINVDGSGLQQIIKGINPKWSPDGKKLVFASNIAGDYNIYTIKPDGSGLQQLTSRTETDIEPCWSPDGEYIAFTSYVNKDWNLWYMKNDGTGLSQLTVHEKFDGGPSWGRNGFIYFHSDRSGNWDIWRLKPSGYTVNKWFEDGDKDGIKDAKDKCPKDAEDMDGYQDEDGCPDTDNDNDGILDKDDKCKNEAETKNGFEDEDGCPDENPIPKKQVLHGVKFSGSSDKLMPDSYPVLVNLAQQLKKVDNVRIEIRAFTDDRGSDAWNLKVSQKRAEAVMTFLMTQGVDSAKMIARGYGESNPIASNNTAAGREQNKRIEIYRMD